MSILVFGKTGQVATELQKHENVIALGRDEADLSDPDQCKNAIRKHKPSMIINAAAYTAVDKAEDEEDLAKIINGVAPTVMAEAAANHKIPFVHISTDYVFNGAGTKPWDPNDATNPLSAYGRTKLLGEEGIKSAGGNYAILRTSWVFSAHGNNFVNTMLRLGVERDRLGIVGDQIGGPTSAKDIAATCIEIAKQLKQEPKKSGVYQYCGYPFVSWANFAREIFNQADLSPEVADIPSSDYATPATRPENSRMNCESLEVFDISAPYWKDSLAVVLNELGVDK